jgi:hypothetical protein
MSELFEVVVKLKHVKGCRFLVQVYMWIFDPMHPRTMIYGVLVGKLE